MMKTFFITLIIFLSALSACRDKPIPQQVMSCKGSPSFVKRIAGFSAAKSYFSTSEIKKMGLVLVENDGSPRQPVLRYYQHPSWKTAGWLSPIQLDIAGNVFTAPAPFINVLDNPAAKQNTVYKVDATSGEMNEFIQLPRPDSLNGNNPYGILGLLYYCEGNILYVSSIAGSDRHVERGGIYAIDVKTKKIVDHLSATDAIGMGITYVTGERKLFFGTGRSSSVYSITITSAGTFKGRPEPAFSLDGLGLRGDDKVRRIRTDAQGNLIVYGVEFNYNLIAPREKPESVYYFRFDDQAKQWHCESIDSKTTPAE
jgi:hypothetical protein